MRLIICQEQSWPSSLCYKWVYNYIYSVDFFYRQTSQHDGVNIVLSRCFYWTCSKTILTHCCNSEVMCSGESCQEIISGDLLIRNKNCDQTITSQHSKDMQIYIAYVQMH